MKNRKLIVVSNRGPYHLHATKQGLKREKTIGGLVTSILPMLEKRGGVWIAWGEPEGRFPGTVRQPSFDLRYIALSAEEVQGYYFGLANDALWPLCHYFMGKVHYDTSQWHTYTKVNEHFARVAAEEAQSEDLIWVHDYHLAMVPGFLRQLRPHAPNAFFWHIPFPSAELFRTLPWRRPFLESLLACDLIGFHVPEYAENFSRAAVEVLGAQAGENTLEYCGHVTRVLARPIGIDFCTVEKQARSANIDKRARQLKEMFRGQALVLGVERLDYTKGIFERLQAMEKLLEQCPELHSKITMIQLVTPSRSDVEAYRQKKREIDEIVGRINGRFSQGSWLPIRYHYRSFSPSELVAYYRAADIALVTPLRDGMNLVAKEYVASRVNEDGVLILSEFAGAASQLTQALLVNPYNVDDLAHALNAAIQMPKEEQRRRMQMLRSCVKSFDVNWWAKEFLSQVE